MTAIDDAVAAACKAVPFTHRDEVRRIVEAAAPVIAAAEAERIRQLAIKHQATYWVGPDDSLAPRRPFALLLQFGDLEAT